MLGMLTGGNAAIVTTGAAAIHIGVVYPCYRAPGVIVMAVFT
jgi:hypothetical protein